MKGNASVERLRPKKYLSEGTIKLTQKSHFFGREFKEEWDTTVLEVTQFYIYVLRAFSHPFHVNSLMVLINSNGGPPTHHLINDIRLRTRVVRQGFNGYPFIDFDSVSSKLSNIYLIE